MAKKAMLWLAAAAILHAGMIAAMADIKIEWGTNENDELYDSYGTKLDSTYSWELGTWADGFTPTGDNVEAWKDNWITFDLATDANGKFNPSNGIFGNEELFMLPDGSSSEYPGQYDFRGKDAYIWGYNSKTYQTGLEWLVFRRDTHLEDKYDWVFPDFPDDDPPQLELEWDVASLTVTDVPLWGNQDGVIGLGWASNPKSGPVDPEVSMLQLYTIPEPGTYVAGALLVLLAAFHMWRTRRNRQGAIA